MSLRMRARRLLYMIGLKKNSNDTFGKKHLREKYPESSSQLVSCGTLPRAEDIQETSYVIAPTLTSKETIALNPRVKRL